MDNNKLISEFMGLHRTEKGYIMGGFGNGTFGLAEELHFHTSWDWLMPVIHRIRDHVNVDMGFEEFDDWRENFKQIDPYNYNLEQCYDAVVEFIKEYNDRQG